jgi:hypothetical protein
MTIGIKYKKSSPYTHIILARILSKGRFLIGLQLFALQGASAGVFLAQR